jgi:flagellar protein FlbD
MITLRRLSGTEFALNSDLIERADSTPDTVISMVDGKKYVVLESLAEVVSAIRAHRAETIALSAILAENPQLVLGRSAPDPEAEAEPAPTTPHLAAVAELHHTEHLTTTRSEAGEL